MICSVSSVELLLIRTSSPPIVAISFPRIDSKHLTSCLARFREQMIRESLGSNESFAAVILSSHSILGPRWRNAPQLAGRLSTYVVAPRASRIFSVRPRRSGRESRRTPRSLMQYESLAETFIDRCSQIAEYPSRRSAAPSSEGFRCNIRCSAFVAL